MFLKMPSRLNSEYQSVHFVVMNETVRDVLIRRFTMVRRLLRTKQTPQRCRSRGYFDYRNVLFFPNTNLLTIRISMLSMMSCACTVTKDHKGQDPDDTQGP